MGDQESYKYVIKKVIKIFISSNKNGNGSFEVDVGVATLLELKTVC
ncbi:hypothetical protein ACVXZY_16410 [Staphylococcus aureus]